MSWIKFIRFLEKIKMKILRIALIVLFLGLIVFSFFTFKNTSSTNENITDKVNYNKPFAETHNDTYDFGKIRKEDGIVSTTFEIENHGKELLVLGDISTSCGCTSASVASTKLGFNEETELTVYFDPNFHEEPEGEFTRSVFVKTNDPDSPEMQFDIHVEILD